MEKIARRIEEWKAKLIDQTRRNRLLYFRPTRSSTLQVVDPSISNVFDRLVFKEAHWRFYCPEQVDPSEGDFESQSSSLILIREQPQRTTPELPARAADELLCSGTDFARIRRTIRNLHRRSRSEFEERGVRILYAAFGMLEWRESANAEICQSPVVLVPVGLERESAREPFKLTFGDEEIVLNPALEAKLPKDFGFQLPTAPDEWEELGIEAYLTKTQEAVAPLGWTVRQECWVATLSFFKLVMYQDLNAHGTLISQHPMTQALAGEATLQSGESVELPDPRQLDDLVPTNDSFLVMDADSSQLACIEAVKRGASLVLQGPPGTGKTQTITNIIAESLASGRKVLFVSEKMAALEQVFERIKAQSLDAYCLELHSHKANKREVVKELERCYRQALRPSSAMTDFELEQLNSRREQLNRYVRALHQVRAPLNRSVYSVLGELAQLESVPYVPGGGIAVVSLTVSYLDRADQLAQRLGRLWRIVVEGAAFPWRGCLVQSYGAQVRAELQHLLGTSIETLARVRVAAALLAGGLDVPTPTRLRDVQQLLTLGELVNRGPGVERSWVLGQQLGSLEAVAQRYLQMAAHREVLRSTIARRCDQSILAVPSVAKDVLAKELPAVSQSLTTIQTSAEFVLHRSRLLAFVSNLNETVELWREDANAISDAFGLPHVCDVDGIKRLLKIGELGQRPDRPINFWLLDTLQLERAKELIQPLKNDYELRLSQRRAIFEIFEESFLSLDLQQLSRDHAEKYQSFLKWLRPGFHRLRRTVRACRRDRRHSPNLEEVLSQGRDIQRLEGKLSAQEADCAAALGIWFRRYETEFDRVVAALEAAKELLALVGSPVPQSLAELASVGARLPPELLSRLNRLRSNVLSWEEEVASFGGLLPVERLPRSRRRFRECSFDELIEWAKELCGPLCRVVEALDQTLPHLKSDATRTARDIWGDLDRVAELRACESELLQDSDRLQNQFGARYRGLDTNWNDVLSAVTWAAELCGLFDTQAIPTKVLDIAIQGQSAAPNVADLRNRIDELSSSLRELGGKFMGQGPTQRPDSPELNVQGLDQKPLIESDLLTVSERLALLKERVDELRDWIDYSALGAAFAAEGLVTLHAGLVHQAHLTPDQLPSITRRTLLQSWVDTICNSEPTLRDFRSGDHQALISEFRTLDRKHAASGFQRVVQAAEKHRPLDGPLVFGGERALLMREANKKKRHLPLRKLFAGMPNLLMRLKPCLLMSPLSVSLFLDPQQIQFDLVVFDEASQICSEDSVGAIYRGKQLVVCGDNRQLPPTSFFDQGTSGDDFDEHEPEDAFDVFESILDECSSINLPQLRLRWHYRSRHESLITFSNRCFYSDQPLVTFPSASGVDPSLGVEFVHVPNGVYDRSGRRDNEKEADKVAQLVLQHLQRSPDKSLGVVAFSIAQRDAIEDRLERVRKQQPELEQFFSRDKPDRVFVKNLESVQGDERDVIIFSIGYGRDRTGKLTMHFGPLNQEGGERRLNVAVTRAREKVVVVSSIRAADMDVAGLTRPGVLNLYRYLDYGECPGSC